MKVPPLCRLTRGLAHAGATLGVLALLGMLAIIVCLCRRRRGDSETESSVYITHSDTVRNPALRNLGRVRSLMLLHQDFWVLSQGVWNETGVRALQSPCLSQHFVYRWCLILSSWYG